MNGTHFRLWIIASFGVLMSCALGTAEDIDPSLEKVLADWQKRQNQVQTVEYRVSGEHKVPRGAYNSVPYAALGLPPKQIPPVNPPQDLTAPVSFRMLLDLVKGRHYREVREQMFALPGKLEPQVMRDAFNGSKMKCIVPKGENLSLNVNVTQPEMIIVSGNMKNGAFRVNYYPIFFAHGRIYTHMEQIIPGQLRNKPDPDYLYIHGIGVQDNRSCFILRTRTLKMSANVFEEYWVDKERDSAILRYADYSGSQVGSDIAIRYRKSSAGWLPAGWRWTVYKRGKTLYYEDMHVDSIRNNPPITDADFELEPKPGMMVEERTDLATKHPIATPASKLSIYRLKENGEKEEIPDPTHRMGDQYEVHRMAQWWRIGLGFLFFLAGAAGFFLWRKRRRRLERS